MPQIKTCYNERVTTDFETLVNSYSEADLASPLRSTVPLLAYWREPTVGLKQVAKALGITFRDPAELLFEHQVGVKTGRGKASHTDLTIRTPGERIAIEGKHREPAYETVSAWTNRGSGKDRDKVQGGEALGENRGKVLRGWIDSINNALHTSLKAEDTQDITYQLIHRTASACEGSAGTRAVVYQLFDGNTANREEYLGQLRKLRSRIGGQSSMRFVLLECQIRSTSVYTDLIERWTNGDKHLHSDIRTGLRDGTLMTFGDCSSTVV